MNKTEIANRIVEIATEVNAYDSRQFHFDVCVTEDGKVHRGDLHINDNSWTQWDEPGDIVAEFSIYPAYSEADK